MKFFWFVHDFIIITILISCGSCSNRFMFDVDNHWINKTIPLESNDYHENFCPIIGFGQFNPNIIASNERVNIQRKSAAACKKYGSSIFVPSLFVMGGRDAEESEFPHMVALGFYNSMTGKYNFDCGGSLISPTFVLTAAHCNPDVERIIARVGSTVVQLETNDVSYSNDILVKNITIHPKYSVLTKLNDIALAELERSVFFTDSIKPLCLYTEHDDPPNLEAIGWGEINFRGKRSSILQSVILSMVPQEKCKELYSKHKKLSIKSTQVCAGNDEKNTCQGDSGGPLQIRKNGIFYVVGITSYGEMCGSRNPGVYTRVSKYLDWIEKIVWPHEI